MMILPILTLCLLHGNSIGHPIPFEDLQPGYSTNPPLVKPIFFTFDSSRGVRDIIWTCLLTTIACTWMALHPNIPALGESWWKVNRRRLKIMMWALIVPEMIMWWALRQASGARRIQERHKDKGWTKCHGFFVQMGGFVLLEPGRSERVLTVEDLEELSRSGIVKWPVITEEEIWDKSKGDLLAKSFIIFQALWFTVQCILRAVNLLTVTELELVTLGYAVLNTFIFALWWNKPLDVRHPVLVERLSTPSVPEDIDISEAISTADDSIEIISTDSSQIISKPVPSTSGKANVDRELQRQEHAEPDNVADYTQMLLCKCREKFSFGIPAFVKTVREDIQREGTFHTVKTRFLMQPFLTLIVNPLRDLSRCEIIPKGARRVPTFYAIEMPTDRTSSHPTSENMRWVSCFAIPIGAIHFTANLSTFPTNSERVLWVGISLLTALLPILFALVSPVVARGLTSSGPLRFIHGLGSSKAFIIAGITLYTLSRILLLVESLALLRALSPNALLSIPWIDYFPHL